jgi:threonine dehydratase
LGEVAPAVALEDVRAAARLVEGRVLRTPCARSRRLSEALGAEIFLKFENLQYTGSFKERGALVRLAALDAAERARGVIAMSAGNHAQAVAYHARELGIPATIVMPRHTPSVKVEQTRSFGAKVVLHGAGVEEAGGFARQLAAERALVLVHPYDDARVIAGQGTVALEMLEAQPDLEALLIPVGGGGLIGGCAVAAKALRPALHVYGVQTTRFPSMHAALRGESARFGEMSIADGIAVKRPGALTLPLVRAHVDELLLVDEPAIEQAVLDLLELQKIVVEGAGAAALAALARNRERFAGRRVGVVLSGGNIDPLVLGSIVQRGLERSGRLVRLRVQAPDVPGALSQIARLIGESDANIIQVNHLRAFTSVPLRSAEVEFALHTRGRDHVDELVAALTEAGYLVELPPLD